MKVWTRNVKMVAEDDLKEIELFFDSSASPHATLDLEVNTMFVRGVVSHVDQLYKVRGVVFLNELLEQLGLPRLQAGQHAGWHHNVPDIVIDEFGESVRITCWVEQNAHLALD